MCGRELGILNLMEYVTFIDERQEEWSHWRKELHRRKAFNACGVMGGFEQIFGFRRKGAHDNEVASVYAVIAFQMDYLSLEGEDGLQILLPRDNFDSLLVQSRELVQEIPCVPETVLERLGEPSMRWGRNDNYPCTMLYLGEGAGAALTYTSISGLSGTRITREFTFPANTAPSHC